MTVPGKCRFLDHPKKFHIKLLSKQYFGRMFPHCSFLPLLELATNAPLYSLAALHFLCLWDLTPTNCICLSSQAYVLKLFLHVFLSLPLAINIYIFSVCTPGLNKMLGVNPFISAVERALDQRLETEVLIPLLPPAG